MVLTVDQSFYHYHIFLFLNINTQHTSVHTKLSDLFLTTTVTQCRIDGVKLASSFARMCCDELTCGVSGDPGPWLTGPHIHCCWTPGTENNIQHQTSI